MPQQNSDKISPEKPVLGMILKGYPRISETFISNEIRRLEALGFRLHLFSMRQPRENFCHDSIAEIQAPVDYLPESLFLYLPKLLYHNLLLAISRPRSYRQALKMAFKRLLRNRRMATVKHLLQAGYLVRRLLPRSGVTHLHAHFAHSPASVAMFSSRMAEIPFSFTAHAKDIYTSDTLQLREKISLARFVVTCTEYNKDYLRRVAGSEETSIQRIYHGIDLDLFQNNTPKQKTGPPFQVLTVARMTPKKGLPTVYRALRILHDRGVDIYHTLIGEGEDRDKISRLIRDLGLSGITRCLGTQPHDVVLQHYRRADLFVLGCEVAPNGDRDGIPNVLLECMAMGVPVVATRVSAIPELIQDGATGLLVPPGRPEIMARAMERLLTENDLRKRLILDARKCVTRDFDNRVLIKALADRFRAVGL